MKEWLEIAKRLPIGHKRREVCPCGTGKAVVISNNGDSFSAYCFRCGAKAYEKVGRLNINQLNKLAEYRRAADEAIKSIGLPNDATRELDSKSSVWLYGSGISDSTSSLANILYSPSMLRCILPVYNASGNLVYWQARSLDKDMLPKYINPQVDAGKVLYQLGGLNKVSDTAIVVEDILSAIKVQISAPEVDVLSILGTKTTDWKAGYLSKYDTVKYWLDPDEAGQRGNREGIRTLSLVTNAVALSSRADPKLLSQNEIRQTLGLPYKEKRWSIV